MGLVGLGAIIALALGRWGVSDSDPIPEKTRLDVILVFKSGHRLAGRLESLDTLNVSLSTGESTQVYARRDLAQMVMAPGP